MQSDDYTKNNLERIRRKVFEQIDEDTEADEVAIDDPRRFIRTQGVNANKPISKFESKLTEEDRKFLKSMCIKV